MAVKIRQEWRTPAGKQYLGENPPPGSKPGDWWILVDWRGQRKKKRVGSKKAADQVRIMIESRLTLGADVIFEESKKPDPPPVPVLFGDYFRAWLETYAKLACKESTWKTYERDFRLYLEPAFAETPLEKIKREAVAHLVHSLLTQERELEERPTAARGERRHRKLSRGTVKNALAALRACLNHALENGKLAANPAIRFGRLLRNRDGVEQHDADFLTAEELSMLLATCHDWKPRYFPFVLTLARTGLRLGEAVALKWGDLDFHGGFLQVVRSFTGGRMTTPKSGKGRRVDMSAGLTEVLNGELVQARARALELGQPLSEWVFSDPRGGRLDGGNFRSRVWGSLLTRAGLRHIRIHDLRHTYASLLIQDGWPLKYIQEQLGHSSISITSDVYGHLVPGANRAAANRLDAIAPALVRTSDARKITDEEEASGKVLRNRLEMVAPGLEPGTSCM